MPLVFEALYWVGASVLGLSLVTKALPSNHILTRAGLGIAVGIAAFFAIDLVVGLAPVGAGPWVATISKALAVVGVAVLTIRPGALQPIGLALVVGTPIGLGAAQVFLNAVVLSYDSYTYLALSQTYFVDGFDLFNDIQRGFYSSYSPGLWMSHANAGLWGGDFLALFQPLVLCATLLIVLGTIQDLAPRAGMLSSLAIGGVVTLFALTAPQLVQHATYIIPNTLGGLFFIGLIVMVLKPPVRGAGPAQAYFWVALGLLSLAFAFARLEASLFFAVITALIAARDSENDLADFGIAGLFIAATIAFQVFVHFVGRTGQGAILTADFSLVLVALSVAALIGLFIVRRTPLKIIRPHLPALTVLAVLAVVIALTVIRGEHAETSNQMFVLNALGHAGIWFNTWLVIGLAVVYYAVVQRDMGLGERLLVATLIAGVLLIIGLGILRSIPYRLGAQDSGNRVLLQLLPLGWIILGLSLHRFREDAVSVLQGLKRGA